MRLACGPFTHLVRATAGRWPWPAAADHGRDEAVERHPARLGVPARKGRRVSIPRLAHRRGHGQACPRQWLNSGHARAVGRGHGRRPTAEMGRIHGPRATGRGGQSGRWRPKGRTFLTGLARRERGSTRLVEGRHGRAVSLESARAHRANMGPWGAGGARVWGGGAGDQVRARSMRPAVRRDAIMHGWTSGPQPEVRVARSRLLCGCGRGMASAPRTR